MPLQGEPTGKWEPLLQVITGLHDCDSGGFSELRGKNRHRPRTLSSKSHVKLVNEAACLRMSRHSGLC